MHVFRTSLETRESRARLWCADGTISPAGIKQSAAWAGSNHALELRHRPQDLRQETYSRRPAPGDLLHKAYSTRRTCEELSAIGLTVPRNFDRSSSAT
jgi:hypothetical protein